jgi:hypothetical protein
MALPPARTFEPSSCSGARSCCSTDKGCRLVPDKPESLKGASPQYCLSPLRMSWYVVEDFVGGPLAPMRRLRSLVSSVPTAQSQTFPTCGTVWGRPFSARQDRFCPFDVAEATSRHISVFRQRAASSEKMVVCHSFRLFPDCVSCQFFFFFFLALTPRATSDSSSRAPHRTLQVPL